MICQSCRFKLIPPPRKYLVNLSGRTEVAIHTEQKCLVKSVPYLVWSNTALPCAGLSWYSTSPSSSSWSAFRNRRCVWASSVEKWRKCGIATFTSFWNLNPSCWTHSHTRLCVVSLAPKQLWYSAVPSWLSDSHHICKYDYSSWVCITTHEAVRI